MTVLNSIAVFRSKCQPFFIGQQIHILICYYIYIKYFIHTIVELMMMTMCILFSGFFLSTLLIDMFFTYQSLWIRISSTTVGLVDKLEEAL